MKRFHWSVVVSLACTSLLHAQYGFQGPWRSNSQAPGEIVGVNHANANPTIVGNGGNGVMLGSVSGTGITSANDDAIFASVAGSVFKVARTTDLLPGLTDVAYGSLDGRWPIYNGSSILFYTSLTGAGTTTNSNEAFIYGNPSSLQILARKGDAVTGLTNVNYSHGSATFRMNSSGTAAFMTNLVGTGTTGSTNQGIALGTPGNLSLAVRKGDAAPGIAATTITGFDTATLTLNGNNALGFQAVLSGSSTTNNALYIKPSGSTPQLLARKGDVAPGGAGGTFNNLTSGNFVLNNNQFAAFRSDLTGVPDNVSGIWAGTPGNLQYVARQGDPTSLAGITYSNTLSSPILMGNNKVAFFSTIAGTGIVSGNDQALWYGDPGSIQLLARTGDAAGSTGLFFRNFYQTFHARSDGSIAFAAQVATSATGGTLRDSLWIVSPSDVSLVVLQGTSITLGPDNLPRTVGSIRMLDANFSGDSDGYSRGMADDGTLGAEIGFPGFQTGVIITAVPEASTVLSLAGAIAGAGAFIWYRRNARQALLSQMVTGEE